MLDIEAIKRRAESAKMQPYATVASHAFEDIPNLLGRIDELEAENERLRETAWTIEMIVDGFNKIAVEERDELKRENWRLQGIINTALSLSKPPA